MKAQVTRTTARTGQPRLKIETTPEKVTLQFLCGICGRVLRIEPGTEGYGACVCRQIVDIAVLLDMAEATLEQVKGVMCALSGQDEEPVEPVEPAVSGEETEGDVSEGDES